MKTELFTEALFAALDETFDTHYGIYLDKGTSLFETLDAMSAADASRSAGRCATIAAHVAHATFYLDVIERYMRGEGLGKIDWRAIWNSVGQVTPEEWERLKRQLRETVDRVRPAIKARTDWDSDKAVGGALAAVVHTAYHLGAIRQALCASR